MRHAEPTAAGTVAAARSRRHVRVALAAGGVLGFSLAVGAIVEPRVSADVPSDAVAAVNGVAIPADAFERAAAALDTDRRSPLTDADRRHVLDRLIDEELLVQRARDLGLDRQDRGVRSRLVAAMVEAVLGEDATVPASDEDVAAFYDANAGFFTGEDRVWVRRLRVAITSERPESEARAAAEHAAARLRAGADFASVERESGERAVVPLPDGPLPASKLRDYLGPTLAGRALDLAPGEVSDPLRDAAAFDVLQMIERETGATPPLTEIEEEVRAEMRRRADDRAFRAYLERLRAQATIATREP